MSNSVDPDETAHMSRLIWIYAVCKSLLLSPVAVKELNKLLQIYDKEGSRPNNKLHACWVNMSSDNILKYFYITQKIGFDISC